MEKRSVTRQLMTHPGVGPLTALAFELVIGTPERFPCGKQIASYVGLVPAEESSGDRRRLGHISKQGNSLLRYLLVEAAQVTVRNGAAGSSTWPCGVDGRSPRSRWPSSWQCIFTGCGVKAGTTASWKSSVRTRERPDIPMVGSKSPP